VFGNALISLRNYFVLANEASFGYTDAEVEVGEKMSNQTATTRTPEEMAELQDKIEKASKAFDLNQHTWRVMNSEPFFAALLRRIDRRKDLNCPTMGVALDKQKGCFYLVYNPRFAAGLDDVGVQAVLMHELYHCIFEHVTSRQPSWKCGISTRSDKTCRGCKDSAECQTLHDLYNFAADLAINSHLKDKLPKTCWGEPLNLLIPGQGETYKDAPLFQSMEYYVNWIKQNPKAMEQIANQNKQSGEPGDGSGGGESGNGPKIPGTGNGSGGGTLDDHSKWVDGDKGDMDAEIAGALASAKAQMKQAMADAVSDVNKEGRGWGTVTADCQKDILERLKSRLDWKRFLRYFVGTSRRADKHHTIKRLNKRYAYIHPGSKVNRHANIAVCVDMSGSVSDSMIATFLGELDGLASIAEFTMVPFDTEVQVDQVFVWKKGKRGLGARVKFGGTDFQSVTDWVEKQGKFDGMIIMTDLEAPKPKCFNGGGRLWITDERHGESPYIDVNPDPMVVIPQKDMV